MSTIYQPQKGYDTIAILDQRGYVRYEKVRSDIDEDELDDIVGDDEYMYIQERPINENYAEIYYQEERGAGTNKSNFNVIAILDQENGTVRYEKVPVTKEPEDYADGMEYMQLSQKESKEKYLQDDYADYSKSNKNGPGKGWHGERMRHREASLKRGMN